MWENVDNYEKTVTFGKHRSLENFTIYGIPKNLKLTRYLKALKNNITSETEKIQETTETAKGNY